MTHLARDVRFSQRCAGRVAVEETDGERRPTCSRCGWVWYFTPARGVLGLAVERGRVLLVRRRLPPLAPTDRVAIAHVRRRLPFFE